MKTGKIAPEYVVLGNVSDLDIETDDLFVLVGRTEAEATLQITLNYFTRQPVRQIIIDGEGISIEGDLIAGSAKVTEDGNKLDYAWPELSPDSTYQAEHEALLSGDFEGACTYREGQDLMRLIDLCRSKSVIY